MHIKFGKPWSKESQPCHWTVDDFLQRSAGWYVFSEHVQVKRHRYRGVCCLGSWSSLIFSEVSQRAKEDVSKA